MAQPSGNPPVQAVTATRDDLRNGIKSDAGTSHVITVAPSAPSGDPDDFYSWPQLGEDMPDHVVEKVKASRAAIPLAKFGDYHKDGKATGFTTNGKQCTPTEVATPEEEKNPKLAAILRRVELDMHNEGGVSSVMTGDPARFTWGRGLTSGVLADAFTDFLQAAPDAKTAFLDCGIAMVDKKWKIVDTDKSKSRFDADALAMLDGRDQPDLKKQLLSAFVKITEDFIQPAADAQWPAFKKRFYYGKRPPPEVEANWRPEAVAYVVHCAAWGSFRGWPEFAKTGGDLHKILRTEADGLPGSYFVDKGDHILVKEVSGGVYPATTMIFGMGVDIMWKEHIVVACPEYPSVQHGDVVFEVNVGHRGQAQAAHLVLRGTPRQFDPNEKYNVWIENHYSLKMADLLKELKHMTYKDLKAHRDWYTSDKNAKKEKWGPRPRVAMDAVLHKGEGENGAWILNDAKVAEITPDHWYDQYDMLKAVIGIT